MFLFVIDIYSLKIACLIRKIEEVCNAECFLVFWFVGVSMGAHKNEEMKVKVLCNYYSYNTKVKH